MLRQSVVLLGSLPVGTVPLEGLVADFGWSLETADSFPALRNLSREREIIAVLFEASMWSLPWAEALRFVQDAAPGAFPVVCHRFSDPMYWPALADAGAFHKMTLPLASTEVRQGLGFVWSARSAAEKKILQNEASRSARVA
jgi:hypothetical protein